LISLGISSEEQISWVYVGVSAGSLRDINGRLESKSNVVKIVRERGVEDGLYFVFLLGVVAVDFVIEFVALCIQILELADGGMRVVGFFID
jgi:hypothetical protein